MKFRKILLGLALAFAINSPVSAAAAEQDTIVFGLTSDIKNFNIVQQFDASWFPSTLYYERLTAMDYGPDFAIHPLLAKSWEISEDGLVYTFHLQENAKWHDGVAFTSEDVKATFEGILANNTYSAPPLRVIDKIETPDAHTVVLRLSRPSASLLPAISTYPRFAILPAHLYGGKTWDKHPNNLNPVGTGAFKLEEHRRGEYISFVRNDDYWGPKPQIERVIYKIIPDINVQIAQLQANEIQALNHPAPLAMEPILNASQGVVVDAPAGPNSYSLMFNITKAPFDNPKVRHALSYAIDRDMLNDRAALGIYKAAVGTYVSSVAWAMNPDVKLPKLDLDKAAALLDEAGFPVVDGKRFDMDIWASKPTEVTSAQIIREQLKPLGINVTLTQMDDILMRAELPKLKHDTFIYGNWWGPDPSEWAQYSVTGGSWNYMGYSNAEVDDLFKQTDLALTQEGRAKHMRRIQEIMFEDMPRIPLFDSGPYSFAHRTELKGWFSESPVSFRSDLRNLRWAE